MMGTILTIKWIREDKLLMMGIHRTTFKLLQMIFWALICQIGGLPPYPHDPETLRIVRT